MSFLLRSPSMKEYFNDSLLFLMRLIAFSTYSVGYELDWIICLFIFRSAFFYSYLFVSVRNRFEYHFWDQFFL